jgi:hypothetical protein
MGFNSKTPPCAMPVILPITTSGDLEEAAVWYYPDVESVFLGSWERDVFFRIVKGLEAGSRADLRLLNNSSRWLYWRSVAAARARANNAAARRVRLRAKNKTEIGRMGLHRKGNASCA